MLIRSLPAAQHSPRVQPAPTLQTYLDYHRATGAAHLCTKLVHLTMSTPSPHTGRGRRTRSRSRQDDKPSAPLEQATAPARKKRATKKTVEEQVASEPAHVPAAMDAQPKKAPARTSRSKRSVVDTATDKAKALCKTATKEETVPEVDEEGSEPATKRKASSRRTKAVEPEDEEETTKKKADRGKKGASGATREMEEELWAQAGVDEAGRGPLAGPVVTAACCIPPGVDIPGVADSKQLDEAQREQLYTAITTAPGVAWAVHVVDHTTIDRVNILQATMMGMTTAASKLPPGSCDYVLVDGNRLPKDLPVPGQAVIQGDARVFCIAAASILAKVTRDRIMVDYHKQYPQWNFAKHKGYAVPAHYQALEEHGISAIHRRSFQPIRGMTGWTREAQLKQEKEEQDRMLAEASAGEAVPTGTQGMGKA